MLVALHRKSSFISIAVVVSEKSTLATKHVARAAGCPTTLNALAGTNSLELRKIGILRV